MGEEPLPYSAKHIQQLKREIGSAFSDRKDGDRVQDSRESVPTLAPFKAHHDSKIAQEGLNERHDTSNEGFMF